MEILQTGDGTMVKSCMYIDELLRDLANLYRHETSGPHHVVTKSSRLTCHLGEQTFIAVIQLVLALVHYEV